MRRRAAESVSGATGRHLSAISRVREGLSTALGVGAAQVLIQSQRTCDLFATAISIVHNQSISGTDPPPLPLLPILAGSSGYQIEPRWLARPQPCYRKPHVGSVAV